MFGNAIPVFPVEDVAKSVEYYLTMLGFKLNWGGQDGQLASVTRGRCTIFLCEGDQGHAGTWTWIGVPDAQVLFEELKAKGAKIRHPPTNYFWALEMQVEDLDGNVLRLGSDPKPGEPYGEWLDMQGRVWPPQKTPSPRT